MPKESAPIEFDGKPSTTGSTHQAFFVLTGDGSNGVICRFGEQKPSSRLAL